jgi:hypothetical protein
VADVREVSVKNEVQIALDHAYLRSNRRARPVARRASDEMRLPLVTEAAGPPSP